MQFNTEESAKRSMKCSLLAPSNNIEPGAPNITNADMRKANQREGGGVGAKPRNCANPVCGIAATSKP
jgi:hypothetical protein